MHVVTMRKQFSMSFSVDAPKGRGYAVPKCQKHKDKRRKPKVVERANFRKELSHA
jgi:hypothetical protein